MIDQGRRKLLRTGNNSTEESIRLPWTINETVFTDNCTQCGDCITACQENIIVKGDGGFPRIDFSKGECTFCGDCVDTCKQPLFTEKNLKPWEYSISIKDDCFAKNNIHCQSCQDLCDQEAISFQYLASSPPQPKVNVDLCNGCGACIAPCPQSSIIVNKVKKESTYECA